MIYYFTPWSYCDNYGKTLNHYMELLPNNDDWAVIRDGDTMFLTEDWGKHFEEAINQVPHAGIITCFSNRVGKNHGQRWKGIMSADPDIGQHRKLALRIRKRFRGRITRLDRWIVGFCMAVKKSTWKRVPFPEDHRVLNVDKFFSKTLLSAGYTIYRMDDMLVFHYYRLNEGTKYTGHLK